MLLCEDFWATTKAIATVLHISQKSMATLSSLRGHITSILSQNSRKRTLCEKEFAPIIAGLPQISNPWSKPTGQEHVARDHAASCLWKGTSSLLPLRPEESLKRLAFPPPSSSLYCAHQHIQDWSCLAMVSFPLPGKPSMLRMGFLQGAISNVYQSGADCPGAMVMQPTHLETDRNRLGFFSIHPLTGGLWRSRLTWECAVLKNSWARLPHEQEYFHLVPTAMFLASYEWLSFGDP